MSEAKQRSSTKKQAANNVVIGLDWNTIYTDHGSSSSDTPENYSMTITLESRKLKDRETPSDYLFRTHHYDIFIKPDETFFKRLEKCRGFFVELRLFKKISSSPDQFIEYCDSDVPVISTSYEEDVVEKEWKLSLTWSTKGNAVNWKGDFCFYFSIFRKMDTETYKKVVTKQSSCFKILSKPEVHANQNSKTAKPAPSKKRKETMTPVSASSSGVSTPNPSAKKQRKQNQFFTDIPPPTEEEEDNISITSQEHSLKEEPFHSISETSLMYDASISSLGNSLPNSLSFPFFQHNNNNSYDSDHHLYAMLDDDGKTISLSQQSISLSQQQQQQQQLTSSSSTQPIPSLSQQQQQTSVNILWPTSPTASIQFLSSQPGTETNQSILGPSTPTTNPPFSLSQPFSPTKLFGSSQDYKSSGSNLIQISFSQDLPIPSVITMMNSPPSSQVSNQSSSAINLNQLRTQQEFVEIFDKKETNVGVIALNTSSSGTKSSLVLSQEI